MEQLQNRIGYIYKISFKPKFSLGLILFIEKFVNSEYKSEDDENGIYNLDLIKNKIEGEGYKISKEDKQILDYLSDKVEYIEI